MPTPEALLLTRSIPIGDGKLPRRSLAGGDRVLQGVDCLDIFGIGRIDESADRDNDVTRADIFLRQDMCAGAIKHRRHIMILVDDLHRHESLAGIRQSDCHGSSIEIEHRRRVKRVAVKANHDLVVDRRRFSTVKELSKTALFNRGSEIGVRFGADKIISRDGHGFGRRRRRDSLCIYLLQRRLLPGSVESLILWPIEAHHDDEWSAWRRQPISLKMLAWRFMLDVKSHATISVPLQLRQHRRIDQVTIYRIGIKQACRQLIKRD
jgi:hypothetical protein